MFAGGQNVQEGLAVAARGDVRVALESDPENVAISDEFGQYSLEVPADTDFSIATYGDGQGNYAPTRDGLLHPGRSTDLEEKIVFACTAVEDSGMIMIADQKGVELQEMLDRGYCMAWINNAPFPHGFEPIAFAKARLLTEGWEVWAANTSEDGGGFDEHLTIATPADETGWAQSRFGFWAAVRTGPPITEPTRVEFEFDASNVGLEFAQGYCEAVPGVSTFQLPMNLPLNPGF